MTTNEQKVEMTKEDDLTAKLEESCPIEGDFDTIAKTFEELNLKPNLLRGVLSHGFVRPSPIQCRAIIPCIQGRDVIAQAQSGTGKTATFVISTLQRINTSTDGPIETQCLVVAPTRELAQQIKDVYVAIGQYCDLKCVGLIGGTSVVEDMEALKRSSAHVVVGTPGRVAHMINNKCLSCASVKLFVLDEADEMLSRGFMDQIYFIFKSLPADVQVILISATMPDNVFEVTKVFMRNPVKIFVKKEQLTLQGIKQFFVVASDRNNKVDAIVDIMGESNVPQMVIFVNTQKDAEVMRKALSEVNFETSYLHAGLKQNEREEIMKKFRVGDIKALITTNLFSRGIDVQGVALVINFDMPRDYETYLHRIGRSGRYGRKGVAINLVLQEELKFIRDLETFYGTQIKELPNDLKILFN